MTMFDRAPYARMQEPARGVAPAVGLGRDMAPGLCRWHQSAVPDRRLSDVASRHFEDAVTP